jgi:protein phosphatase
VVSSDRCREIVADDEGAIWASPEAFEVFYHIIEARLQYERLTVADSTAVQQVARKTLIRIARRLRLPTVLIVFNIPEEVCIERDGHRVRHVDNTVIHQQWLAQQRALGEIATEGHHRVVVLTEADLDRVSVEFVPRAERQEHASRSKPPVMGARQRGRREHQ